MLKFFFTALLLIAMASCSGVKSGRYVKMRSGEDANSLATKYNVRAADILAANFDKKLTPGNWVFIPWKAGVLDAVIGQYAKRVGISPDAIYVGKFLWPVPSSTRISSKFGKRWGKRHDGIDIPAKKGTHILAAEKGKVIHSGRMRGYGRVIIVAHKGGTYTVYAHNNKNFVKKNQRVHRGQVIGKVGNSGRSTGSHLHFEIRIGDQSVNPISYVTKSRQLIAKYK